MNFSEVKKVGNGILGGNLESPWILDAEQVATLS